MGLGMSPSKIMDSFLLSTSVVGIAESSASVYGWYGWANKCSVSLSADTVADVFDNTQIMGNE